ncbi:tripeptidyl-peptidase [Aureococcus anophagefferens]|nr:tripeptidyl-peptidase [Aureococcus anophagefferens]
MADEAAYLLADEDAGLLGGVRAQARRRAAGGGSVYRCDGDYSLPAAVYASVHAVYGVAELPVLLGGAKRHVEILDGSDVRGHDRRITPQKLQRFYGIDAEYMYASGPPTRATQALFETIGQEYSPGTCGPSTASSICGPREPPSVGHVVDRCDDPGDCAEGNLDVQYMTALARARADGVLVGGDQDFSDPSCSSRCGVSNMEHPPLVTSISYGSLETALVPSVMRSFNVAAMKLALMGATVFVSSGDDGVANVISRASQCAYAPSYPASSPWVVAVGATTTTNDWSAPGEGEVVCQSDYEDSVITSGGGFSTVFDAHNYTRPAGFGAGLGPGDGLRSVDYGRFEALFLSDLDAATIFAAKARLRLR